MIILLTLLSLCATDCRVHRNPCTNTVDFGVTCNLNHPWMGDSCVVDSHYLPCVVVEKCDTTWTVRYRLEQTSDGTRARCDSSPIIRCHPDTLVDSGVVRFPTRPLRHDEVLPDGNLTPVELADLREMLREWRIKRCIEKILPPNSPFAWEWDFEKAVKDSCECVYGGGK